MMRLPPSSWGLIAVNAALLAASVWMHLSWPELAHQIKAVKPPSATVPETSAQTAGAAADYSVLRDRAIFYTAREFAVAITPAAATLPKPQYTFVAAMMLPAGNIAYLRKAQGMPALKVRVGEILEGWTVAGIERNRVLLQLAGESFAIEAPGRGSAAGLTKVEGAQVSRIEQ